ncbi:MAG: monofunctional biosynthetic peptidoglycan transglycosylase [Paracoccaceae bacterium]
MARLKRKTKGLQAKRKAKPKRRSLVWRLLRRPAKFALGLLIFVVLWVWSYSVINPPGGLYMGWEAWRLGGVSQDWRDLEQISPQLARAAMAGEDARFCDHNGFDFEAIEAALRANEQGRRIRGGSTITQQVAKNVFLWHERSWARKGLEAGFTVLIEVLWTKRRVLEVYLNIVELAPGVFGAEAGARHHFGRPAAALSLTQAARLAAILPAPKSRSASKPSAYTKRRGRSIAAGAETLRREARDRCVFD